MTQVLKICGSTDRQVHAKAFSMEGSLLKAGTLTETELDGLLSHVPCGEVLPAPTTGNWFPIFFVSTEVTLHH